MEKEFLTEIRDACEGGFFVKLSLGGYRGDDPSLKKIVIRPVIIKQEEKLSFTYSHKTKDIVKNHTLSESLSLVAEFLRKGFTTGTLFTTRYDLTYPSLRKSDASVKEAPQKNHDRMKTRHVETRGKKYLQDLKITDASGNVFKNAQDKYRQIDKYVEILSGLVKDIPKEKLLNIVDMGAGKGYLTFALYDHLVYSAGRDVTVTGVEYRSDLVKLCNGIAKNSGFDNLIFSEGTIADYDASGANILIALHACDTATDDAIAKGIAAQSDLIVVAPCCHKQIRQEMAGFKNHDLDFLLYHGTFLERQAEMVTDALRALILEYFGYSVKIFEFISDSHTPKNVMIVAQRTMREKQKHVLEKISDAKKVFGVRKHYLESVTDLRQS